MYKVFQKEGLWQLFLQLSKAGIGAQIIALAVYPIIGRLYPPDAFGLRASFVAIFMLILPFTTLNLEFAIPLESDDQKAKSLFRSTFLFTFFLSLLILLVVLSLYFIPIFKHPLLPFLGLLPIALLAGGWRKVALGWASRLADQKSLTHSKYWMAGTKSSLELIGGWQNANVWLLIIGQIAGMMTVLGFLYRQMYKEVSLLLRDLAKTPWRSTIINFSSYPKFTLASTFSDLFNTHFPLLFFGSYLSMDFAGQYSMAILMIYLIHASFGDAFAQAYLVELGKNTQERKRSLYEIFRKSFWRITGLGIILGLGIALLGPYVLLWVLGTNWVEASRMIPVLSPLIVIYFWNALCFHTLNKLSKQKIIFNLHLLRMLFLLLCFLYLQNLGRQGSDFLWAYVGNTLFFSLLILIFSHLAFPKKAKE